MTNQSEHGDILIIGGGSAGCVLAARLSERPGLRVVLVEAGQDVRAGAIPPDIASAYPGRAFLNPDYLWPGLRAFMGASRANAPDARPPRKYEQARILGGGSCINAMVANRGAPSDYDEWGVLGAEGWSWDSVLPYFRKLETDCDFGGDLHGHDGPITIRRRSPATATLFVRAVRDALTDQGLVEKNDYNGPWEDGFFPVTLGCGPQGQRLPVSQAYLTDEVRRRPNLRILTHRHVTRLVCEGTRVVGAEIAGNGGMSVLRARETIVSCGGIHSPVLLMRSGIGPANDLQSLGIGVVVNRQGVGRNLLEHPSLAVSAYLPPALRLYDDSAHQAQTCIRLSSGEEGVGTGDLFFQVLAKSAWHAMGRRLGTIFFWVNKSYSTGRVRLTARDPHGHPHVDFAFLSDARDRRRMLQSVRFAGGILNSLHAKGVIGRPFPTLFSDRVKKVSAVNRVNAIQLGVFGTLLDVVGRRAREALLRAVVTEGSPLDDLFADERALEAFVLASVGGTWHPSGTCRMGSTNDPAAVTDGAGRVIGVSGLRVCDGSVMPSIPRANTNIPIIMIAERISDLIGRSARTEAQ